MAAMERYSSWGVSWHDVMSIGSLLLPLLVLVAGLVWTTLDSRKRDKEEEEERKATPWKQESRAGVRRRPPAHADIVAGRAAY